MPTLRLLFSLQIMKWSLNVAMYRACSVDLEVWGGGTTLRHENL